MKVIYLQVDFPQKYEQMAVKISNFALVQNPFRRNIGLRLGAWLTVCVEKLQTAVKFLRFHLVLLVAQNWHCHLNLDWWKSVRVNSHWLGCLWKTSFMNFFKIISSISSTENLFSCTRLLLIRKYILFEDFKDAHLTMGNGLLLTNVCASFQRKWKHLWNALSALGSSSYVLSSGGM